MPWAREKYFSVARAELGIQSINKYFVLNVACLQIRVCALCNVVHYLMLFNCSCQNFGDSDLNEICIGEHQRGNDETGWLLGWIIPPQMQVFALQLRISSFLGVSIMFFNHLWASSISQFSKIQKLEKFEYLFHLPCIFSSFQFSSLIYFLGLLI